MVFITYESYFFYGDEELECYLTWIALRMNKYHFHSINEEKIFFTCHY
jgi:hypothetical protein